MAVLAPIPRASDRIATIENNGLRTSPRTANLRSLNARVIPGLDGAGGQRVGVPRLAGASEVDDDVPVEFHETGQLALEDPLLVAVRAEALWTVLDVERRADAEALHPLGTQVGHVGRAR